MRRDFCTYLDHRYLSKMLVMHRSMIRHIEDFRLWVLCLDDLAHAAITRLDLDQVVPIRLSELEHGDHQLIAAKEDRSQVEYYFTITPSLPLFIFEQHADVEQITYVDADLRFFSDPAPLFLELDGGSISIIPHRFPDDMKHLEIAGIFNVGWLTFQRDERALEVLKDWREKCIDWCYDRFEDGRFADQKYLDEWPERFRGVVVLKHPGANLAPWNLGSHRVDMLKDGSVSVDGLPLIFFHYHGLKRYGRLWDLNLAAYQVWPTRDLVRGVFVPYIRELRTMSQTVRRVLPEAPPASTLRPGFTRSGDGLTQRTREFLRLVRDVLRRRYLLVVGSDRGSEHVSTLL